MAMKLLFGILFSLFIAVPKSFSQLHLGIYGHAGTTATSTGGKIEGGLQSEYHISFKSRLELGIGFNYSIYESSGINTQNYINDSYFNPNVISSTSFNTSDLRYYQYLQTTNLSLYFGYKIQVTENFGISLRYLSFFKMAEKTSYEQYNFSEVNHSTSVISNTDFMPNYNNGISLNLTYGRSFKFHGSVALYNMISISSPTVEEQVVEKAFSTHFQPVVNLGFIKTIYSKKFKI